MWDTLKDPLALLSVVVGVAMLFEIILKPRHKDALRNFLHRVQQMPIVPPRAIGVIDRIFGTKLFSIRSFLTSAAISIVGAAFAFVIILLTTPTADVIAAETWRVATSYPGPVALFFVTFLVFDIASFFVTRAFVIMASQSASLGRAVLLFFADLFVSVAICLAGLGAASTAMVATVPDNFWMFADESVIVTHPREAAYAVAARLEHGILFNASGVQFADATPAMKDQIEREGMLSIDKARQKGYSAQVDIMLGEDPERIAARLNSEPRKYRIDSWTCDGAKLDVQDRETLLRGLYGSGRRPSCPLPTFYFKQNLAPLTEVDSKRIDDIFLGMTLLYADKLAEVIVSKFNEYVDVSVPTEWADTLYLSTVHDAMPWFFYSIDEIDNYAENLYYYYPALTWDASFKMDPVSPPVSLPAAPLATAAVSEGGKAIQTSEDSEGSDYSFDSYEYWDNTYSYSSSYYDELYLERSGWDGEYSYFTGDLFLPISPFLTSALWMSAVFYLFVLVALAGTGLRMVLAVKNFLLGAVDWTNAPVGFVAFLFSAAFLAIALLIEFL